jgi:hypothetical protein
VNTPDERDLAWHDLGWFQWQAVPPARRSVSIAAWSVSSACVGVAGGMERYRPPELVDTDRVGAGTVGIDTTMINHR